MVDRQLPLNFNKPREKQLKIIYNYNIRLYIDFVGGKLWKM